MLKKIITIILILTFLPGYSYALRPVANAGYMHSKDTLRPVAFKEASPANGMDKSYGITSAPLTTDIELLKALSGLDDDGKIVLLLQRLKTSSALEDILNIFYQLSIIPLNKDSVKLQLQIKHNSGDIGTENIAVPAIVLTETYDEFIEYLTMLVELHAEMLGAEIVNFNILESSAHVDIHEISKQVQQRFDSEFKIVADSHANVGEPVLWQMPQLIIPARQESVKAANVSDINYAHGTSFGIDIGGSNIKIVLIRDGKIISKKIIPISRTKTALDQLIEQELFNLGRDNGLSDNDIRNAFIRAGIPGYHDRKGSVLDMPNLEISVPGASRSLNELYSRFPNLQFENDANLAAQFQVALRGIRSPVIVNTLGTGLGISVAINGRIAPGPFFSHIKVNTSQKADIHNCGVRGCLEGVTSAEGVVNKAISLAEQRGIFFPKELSDKIHTTTPENRRYLCEDISSLLSSERTDLRELANDVFGNFSRHLMLQYAVISRLMNINDWTVILTGGISKGLTGEVIKKGIMRECAEKYPAIKLNIVSDDEPLQASAVSRIHNDISADFHGAVGSALLGLQAQHTDSESNLSDDMVGSVVQFMHSVARENLVVFMDKDYTVTPTSEPIEEDMLYILINLVLRGVDVVIITGTNPEKTYPCIIEPIEQKMRELGLEEYLAYFRFYYLSGAGGARYDHKGQRHDFVLPQEFSETDRTVILKYYALSFLEEVQETFSISLAESIQHIHAAASLHQIKEIFDQAIGENMELLGPVTLVDDPRGCILELASEKGKANECVANNNFMGRVCVRYEKYVTGKLEKKPIIKHGPTFITTNLIDKEIVIAKIGRILGLEHIDIIKGGDSRTDYGFLKYKGINMNDFAFLVGEPAKAGERLPDNVVVSNIKGPDGTKRILEIVLLCLDGKLDREADYKDTKAARAGYATVCGARLFNAKELISNALSTSS